MLTELEQLRARIAELETENRQLLLAEEGAKEAFGHVIQQKRDLEAECKRLRELLAGAYETLRQNSTKLN